MDTAKVRRDMPGHTCPSIDRAIAELESLRQDNAALRETALEALDEVDNLQEQIVALEEQVDVLQEQIDTLRDELAVRSAHDRS